jgi:hypothetical protein
MKVGFPILSMTPSGLRAAVQASMAAAALCLGAVAARSAEPPRLVSSQAGPGGVVAADSVRLEFTVASLGLVASEGAIRLFPGFVSELPNGRPTSTNQAANRSAGSAIRIATAAAAGSASDPDGDRMRVVSVNGVSLAGGRVELDGDWITYFPPEGGVETDRFRFLLADSFGDADEAEWVVAVRTEPPPDAEPPRNQLPPRVDPVGNLQLRFAGIPNRRYRLQATLSMTPPVDWTNLAELRATAAGQVLFTDTNAPSTPTRFYRLTPR